MQHDGDWSASECDLVSWRCSVPGSQQQFVLKNLNAAYSLYYVKLRAVNGRGSGLASAVIAVNTVLLPGWTLLQILRSRDLHTDENYTHYLASVQF